MKDIFLNLINTIVMLVAIYYGLELKKHFNISSQIRRVKWCINELSFDYLYSMSTSVPDGKYVIDYTKDRKYINAIIDDFALFMKNNFFADGFSQDKRLKKLSDKDFVLLYFNSYLLGLNLSKRNLDGEDMINFSHEEEYTRIYNLTDYGYAFYRLLFSVQLYCKQNNEIMKTSLCSLNIYNIQNSLDNGTYISYQH